MVIAFVITPHQSLSGTCSRPVGGADPEASVADAVFEQAFIPKRMDEVGSCTHEFAVLAAEDSFVNCLGFLHQRIRDLVPCLPANLICI